MRNWAKLEVKLNLLESNFKKIRKRCPNNQIIFMVKADGYGHGATEVVRHAFDHCQIESFGCATMGEAVALRKELAPRKMELIVFSETELDDLVQWKKNYLGLRITPVIYDLETLERVLGDHELLNLPLMIKINTGMNRFGINCDHIDNLIGIIKKFNRMEVDHLMTHFPCSPDKSREQETLNQYQLFKQAKTKMEEAGVIVKNSSVSNSGAIERGIGLEESFIRPGILAYGPNVCLDNPSGWKGSNISSLKAKALYIRRVKQGDPLGYGSIPAATDGVLAVLPLGYADGMTLNYYRSYIKCGEFVGQVATRVNMDVSLILFEDDRAYEYIQDTWIEIWGESVPEFLKLVKQVKTIPYQLFCQVSPRVPRDYKH